MKPKKILITYLGNGNLHSQIAKEFIFNRVIDGLISEGRVVSNTISQVTSKYVFFEDGTKVSCVPFTRANKGMKVTHLFVDEALTKLSDKEEIIYQCLLPTVINWGAEEFDISESPRDRAKIFSFENSKLITRNI